MKRVALVLIVFYIALPLTASAATINFDEFAVSTPISNQYLGLGVWFSNYDTLNFPVIAVDGANPTSPVLSGSPPYTGGFWMAFVSPQNHVSFDSGYWDSIGSGFVRVQDSGLNVLADLTNPASGIYTFDLYYADIKYITFSPGLDPNGAAIDNLNFAPIPEPSTMMLLGSGLAGLVGYGRRRLKK